MLHEEVQVPTATLPVDAFKAHLRLGTGFSNGSIQDAVLESFLRAAIAAVEARTGKALLTRNFSWRVTAWRNQQEQVFPIAPVSAVLEVVRISANDAEEVIDPGQYRLVADMHAPCLVPGSGLLPTIPTGGAMRVRFSAGFGLTWSDMPPDIAQAVMLLATHYYEFRAETNLSEGCMPFGVTSLLARYRNLRMGWSQ